MSRHPDTTPVEWSRVVVADRFWSRLRGMIGRPDGTGLLLRCRSVHGFWLSRDLRVYGIDGDGLVISTHRLGRRRIVRDPGATWMLEIPLAWPELSVGDRIPAEPMR